MENVDAGKAIVIARLEELQRELGIRFHRQWRLEEVDGQQEYTLELYWLGRSDTSLSFVSEDLEWAPTAPAVKDRVLNRLEQHLRAVTDTNE
jgi:hypothetical protein